ncbi:MAG: fibronectin type III domain-containing protein, partial [Paludibacteraceae bacterium]|nr:fibronectin type III domain-containing protein [Paludibacteraceae bacterium]
TGFNLSLDAHGYPYNVLVTKRVTDSKGRVVENPAEMSAGDTLLLLSNQSENAIRVPMSIDAAGLMIEVFVQAIGAGDVAGEWSLPAMTRLPMFLAADQMPYKIDWEDSEANTWSEKKLYPFSNNGVTYNYPNSIITATLSAPNGYGQNKSYTALSSGTTSQEGKSTGHYIYMRKEGNRVTAGDPEIYGYKHKYGNYIALPEVADLSKVLLKFYMKRYSSSVENSSRVAVGILTDPYDISTFDTVATFEATSATEYQPFSCAFGDYKGEGKIIAIQAIESDNPYESGSLSSSGYGWAYVYYSNQYLDWINLYALGECNPIANPVVETAHDSVTISWGANDMEEWIVRVKDAKGVMVDSVKVNTTQYGLGGLSPHSDYTYMVSPICDASFEMSDWLSFTTECLPENPLPFVDDFESEDYTAGSSKYFIPFCWSAPLYTYTYSGGGESSTSYYPYITTTYAHNGKRSFCLSSNSSATNQNNVWVALPIMADSVKKLQVEFFVRGYSSTQNSMLQVGVMTDPSDISTFEVIDSVNVVGATLWNGAIVKFDKYAGEGKYIAFKRNFERDGKSCNYYLDDITVDYIKDCEKLFSLTTSEPTTNGATFTWNKTNADKYEVLVLKENINPNSADTTGKVISLEETTATSMVYRNDALELNKIYYAYVRTICGILPTTWSEGASFRTTCLPKTPAEVGVEDFSEATVLGCWTLGCMNGTSIPTRYGSATGKFKFLLRIFNTTSTDGAYAIMPPLDIEDISKYQITFDACTNSSAATNVKSITVGIISNAADLSTFAPITTITGLNYTTDSTGMFRYTIPFDSYDGDFVTGAKGNQVMFLSESGDGSNEAFIDNISFRLIDECATPSTVVADSVGTYGAKISWNKTGAEYELAVTSTKVAPDDAKAEIVKELKNLKDTFATVEGLEMLTQYFMYVRTICGEGDTSVWSNARTFTTTCPEAYALPFAEDFEKSANTGASYKPDCWTYYYLNGTTITEGKSASYPSISGASYSHSSKYCMYMYSDNAATKKYSFAATPYIENDLSKAMISFWYKANAYAAATPTRKLVVGIAEEVSTLDTLYATLSVLDTIVQTNTSSTIPYEKYSRIVSEKYNGNGHYIVLISIEGNGTTSSGGMYVDDIEISLVPSCFLPDNLKADKMYDTSAELSWEQLQGDNKAWDVAYGLAGAAEADLTIVTADTNVFVINGLQPSTAYDFYVRANCGDEFSEWRGPVTAATLYQVALADAQWSFENGEPQKAQAPTGTNKIPQNWFVNNVHTGLATVGNAPYITYNTKNATTGLNSANKAYSGDSVMYFYSGTTTGLTGYGPYAVLPVINDVEDYDSLQVRFMARVTYSNTPSKVDGRDSMMYVTYSYAGGSYKRELFVGVASDPYDMSTFEELTQYVFPTLGVTSSGYVDITKNPDPEGTNYWREVVVPLYGTKGKYIILAGSGNYNVVFVDDVKVEKVDPNACANVTKLALDEESLKYNAAAFTWNSPKKNFKVTITEKDSVEIFAQATVDTAFFSIDTLQAQTAYTISVQAVCGEDLSKAVTLNFTTPCKPAEKEEASWNFTDNLVQWGTSATYVIPQCWDEGLGFGSSASYTPYVIANTTTYSYTRHDDDLADRSLRFNTTTSYYNAYAVLPELGFELDSMTLHFWGRAAYFYSPQAAAAANKCKLYSANGNYSRTLVVGTIADVADFSTFMPIDTITYDQVWTATAGVFEYNDPLGNNYWQEYALPLAKYAGKGRIAIVAPKPTSTSYFFVDDLEVIKGDFCTSATGLKAENVTANSATIRWTEIVINPYVQVQVATSDEFEAESLILDQKVDSANS